jgi:hypothetical protein
MPGGCTEDCIGELALRLLTYIADHHRGTVAVLKPKKIRRILGVDLPVKYLFRLYRVLEGYGFRVVPMRGGGGRRPLYAVIIDMSNPVIRDLRAGRIIKSPVVTGG